MQMGQMACRPWPVRKSPKVQGPEDSGPEGSDARRTAAAWRKSLGGYYRVEGFRNVMTNGRERRQNRNRGRCRISHLREGRTGVADFPGEEVVLVAKLGAADRMDVTEFVQHRALLGEEQQQGKNQCKAKFGNFHGLAKNYPQRPPQHPKSSL